MINKTLLLFGVTLLSALAVFAQDSDVIRVDTNLVTIPVIVSDRDNRYVSGLKQNDFTIYKNGEKQSIDYFAAEEAPISVAILLDTSRSTELVLGKIKKAAREFIKQLKPSDRAMIVTFDADVEVLSSLTSDREKLNRAIKDAEIGDNFGTVLNDAVYETISNGLSGFKGRKAVILLTDGKDAGSYVRQSDLLYRLAESDALVYSIYYETGDFLVQRPVVNERFPGDIFGRNGRGGMGRGGMGRGGNDRIPERRRRRIERNNEEAKAFLTVMAEKSAGRFFGKGIDDLSKTFAAIADELRNQYLIGFYPENVEAGKSYAIRVVTNRSETVVRAKTAFRVK